MEVCFLFPTWKAKLFRFYGRLMGPGNDLAVVAKWKVSAFAWNRTPVFCLS